MQSNKLEAKSQDGPRPPAHVKKKLTKKVQFLERVADSKQSALAARAGVHKKPHKRKNKRRKALPDLSSLADVLAQVERQPTLPSQQQDSKQQSKQKGRTEQITTSKARRVVTYASLPLDCPHSSGCSMALQRAILLLPDSSIARVPCWEGCA